MTTATIYPTSNASRLSVIGSTVLTLGLPGPPPGMPPSISRSQLYYWSQKWRADEAESLAELAAGEGRRFENAQDAIRWLLSNEE